MRKCCCACSKPGKTMEYDCFVLSTGSVSPDCNEDFAILDAELGIFVVADGVGGKPAGDQASRLAGQSFLAALRGEPASRRLADEVLNAALEQANRELLAAGEGDVRLKGLSSTMTALVLDAARAKAVHVGDSRLYRYAAGTLSRLTTDHNLATELAATGAEGAAGLQRWLSRALGFGAQVKADIVEAIIRPGDIFVLATDGLAKSLPDARLESVLDRTQALSARSICEQLMSDAMSKPLDDDTTICIVKTGIPRNHDREDH